MEYLIGGLVGAALVSVPALWFASKAADEFAELQEWFEEATKAGSGHVFIRNRLGQLVKRDLPAAALRLLQADYRRTRAALAEMRAHKTNEELDYEQR